MNIIGIDLGGTKILGVLSDGRGNVSKLVRRPTEAGEGLEAVVGRIAGVIAELAPSGWIDAIGLGVPGPLNPMEGLVYEPPNLPGWKDVPLCELVRSRMPNGCDVPIALVNDANAAALAEYRFGAGAAERNGEPLRNLVYLTISTGVGGGVVSDGRLLLGATGMAAELGHMVIDLHGPRCLCGNRGCLEAMASGTALAREGQLVVRSRRPTLMAEMVGDDPQRVTAKTVVEAAQRADHEAGELLAREGMLVGVGVVNCIHAFNPQLVVLGGGVANAGDLLFGPVRATVEDRVMPSYKNTFKIVPAGLGGESGAMGAVVAAIQALQLKFQKDSVL